MTYREARQQVANMLRDAGIENEAAESMFLLEYSCELNRNFYLLHQMDPMNEAEEAAYFAATAKRCQHIPLQYLTGEQEFMGLSFRVNENVLIPRQDTEVLVEQALEIMKKLHQEKESESLQVLDMCTGSGCIAISLKAYDKTCTLTAADLSEGALEVARENARQNQTEVAFIHSDLFCNIQGRYDMIVSNPPYIPSKVIPTLMPEVRMHEPMSALDGMEDGLFFYRKITNHALEFLKPGGYLIYEIGHDQGQAVSEMMREHGFDDIEVITDLAGLDRVVKGRSK